MAVDNNEEKNKIVLNRKMRLWNKYKKPVIGVILAVVVIAVVAIVLKLCSIGTVSYTHLTLPTIA